MRYPSIEFYPFSIYIEEIINSVAGKSALSFPMRMQLSKNSPVNVPGHRIEDVGFRGLARVGETMNSYSTDQFLSTKTLQNKPCELLCLSIYSQKDFKAIFSPISNNVLI